MEQEPIVEAVCIPIGAVYGGKRMTEKAARIFEFQVSELWTVEVLQIEKLSVCKLRWKGAFCGFIGIKMRVASNRLV